MTTERTPERMHFWASVDVIEGAQRINAGNARPWKLEEVGEKLKNNTVYM